MADKSKIEWCDASWNPIVGCSKVSPACDNCYAEVMARRLAANPQTPWYKNTIKDGEWSGEGSFIPHVLEKPLSWKKGRRIFVCSMSDLFHESTPVEYTDKVFAVMALCPQHTFQVLTKRPERMRKFMSCDVSSAMVEGAAHALYYKLTGEDPSFNIVVNLPLPNVWLGVTVEDQKRADERIPILLDTPAAKRFVSCEPLLGSVDLGEWLAPPEETGVSFGGWAEQVAGPPLLDWVITDGESGPNARPSHPDWFRSLRDQCVDAGVPFFFKQMDRKRQIPEDLFIREFPYA